MSKKKRTDPKILYLRVDQGLFDRLEDMRKQQVEQNKGVKFSMADTVRAILWKAIDDRINEQDAML